MSVLLLWQVVKSQPTMETLLGVIMSVGVKLPQSVLSGSGNETGTPVHWK